jgi:hypothetical protein
MAADDLTTTLRFTADTGNVEASLKRLIAGLQSVVRTASESARASMQLAGAQTAASSTASAAAASAERLARRQTSAADATLREAQALARLQQIQGNSPAAIQTLENALQSFTGSQLQAIRAQTQLAALTTNYNNSPFVAAIRQQTDAINQFAQAFIGSLGGPQLSFAVDTLISSLQNITNNAGSTADSIGILTTATKLLGAGLAVTAAGALAILPVLQQIGSAGIQAAAQLEQARIGIASIVASVGTLNRDGVKLEGVDALNAALPLASEQIEKIRIDALQTALTFEQISQGFLQAIGPGLSAGLNLDQIRKIVVDLSQLVGPLTGSVGQLGQELRAILSGDINQDTQTAKALGLTRQQILAAREQNRLADFLNEKLKVAAVTGRLVGQTFDAATSNLREAGTILSTQVTKGLFDSLRQSFNSVLPRIFTTIGDQISLKPAFEGLAGTLREIFDSVGVVAGKAIDNILSGLENLSAFLSRNREELSRLAEVVTTVFGTAFSTIGTVLGTIVKLSAELVILATRFAPVTAGLGSLALLINAFGPGATLAATVTAKLSTSFTTLTTALAATRAALVSTSTFLLTTPAGWAILAASVAAAGLAYAAFNDRQQELIDSAGSIQLDQVTAQFARLREVQSQLKELDTFTGSQANLNTETERYRAILATLPATQQVVINSLATQTERVDALREALRGTAEEQLAAAREQQAVLLQGIAARQAEIERTKQLIAAREEEIRKLRELAKANGTVFTEATAAGGEVAILTRNLSDEQLRAAQSNLEARGTLAELTKAQESNLASLRKLLPALGETEQQLLATQANGLLTAEQLAALRKALDSVTVASPNTAGGVELVSGKAADLAKKAAEAKEALNELFATGDTAKLRQQISKRLDEITASALQSGKGIRGAQEALKTALSDTTDPLSQQIKTLKNAEAISKGLQSIVNPEKKSGGSTRGTTDAQRTAEAEYDLLKLREQRTQRSEQLVTASLEAELRDRLISQEAYTLGVIASEKRILEVKKEIFAEDRRRAQAELKNPTQLRAAIGEINERELQAVQDFNLRVQRLRDEQRQADAQAEAEHQQRLLDIREQYQRQTESLIRDNVAAGEISRSQGERQLIALERERYQERESLLRADLALVVADASERQKLQDQLRALAADRAAFELDASARIRHAQAQEAADFGQLIARRIDALIDLQKAQIAARAAEVALGVQRGRINARAAGVAEIEQRRQLLNLELTERIRQIEQQADLQSREAAQAGRHAGILLQIEQTKNALILAEKRRASAEQQQLTDQQNALELSQMASLQTLFSQRVQILAQSVGLFQASVTSVTESIEASIQPLDGILTQAITSFADSLGSVVEQYVLMGKTGPAVIRKLLAAQLAAIAKEAAVNAIKQTALGFAALFTNPAEAGSHFASAAQWALLAGTAGAVGRAISPASSAGVAGGGGSTRGTAGQAGTDGEMRVINQGAAFQRQPQVVVIRAQYQPGIIVEQVVDNYRTNGALRETLRRDLLRE